MARLETLLEIQELDQAADAARARFASLPEHAALPALAEKRAAIEVASAAVQAEKIVCEGEEAALGTEVGNVAKAIEQADVERYSGKRIDRDEATAHDAAQAELREKQTSLEEQEMTLLEKLEALDALIAGHRTAAEENHAEIERTQALLAQQQAELATELEGLSAQRDKLVPALPPIVVAAYDRVRAQPRAAGRGCATLSAGQCGGCRIKLPSLEVTKMLAEPDDAVIQCPQCRRVLVRP